MSFSNKKRINTKLNGSPLCNEWADQEYGDDGQPMVLVLVDPRVEHTVR